MLETIKNTDYLRGKIGEILIQLLFGNRASELANEIEDKTEIPYPEIPNFPVSTVEDIVVNLLLEHLVVKKYLLCRVVFTTTKDTT